MYARQLVKNLKSLLKMYGDAEVMFCDSRFHYLELLGVYTDCYPNDGPVYMLFPRTSEEQKAILKEEALKKS